MRKLTKTEARVLREMLTGHWEGTQRDNRDAKPDSIPSNFSLARHDYELVLQEINCSYLSTRACGILRNVATQGAYVRPDFCSATPAEVGRYFMALESVLGLEIKVTY